MVSTRLANVTPRTSCPSIRTAPSVASYRRGTSIDIVVLPAPDRPTSAVIVPGSAVNDTPLSTQSDGSSVRTTSSPSNEAIDPSVPAGYRNQTSSKSTRPLAGDGNGT